MKVKKIIFRYIGLGVCLILLVVCCSCHSNSSNSIHTSTEDTTIVLEYSGRFNQEMMQEIPANADLDVTSGEADLTLSLSVEQNDCTAAGTISLEGGIVDYMAEGEASTISLESGVTAYLCVTECELSEEDDHSLVFTIYTIPAEDKTYIQVAETPSSEDEDVSLHRIYIFGEMFDEMTEITTSPGRKPDPQKQPVLYW